MAQHHGPDLCGASDQKLDPFLLVERPQSRHQSAQTHLRAATIEAAALALDDFETEWGGQYPAIVDLWRRNWERFCPFLAFDAAIRKIIYTTNAIESLNYQLRKVTKTRGHFPTEDAVLKILYLAIRNIGNNRGGELGTGTQGWKQALNAFAITFPDASTRQHEPQPHTKNLTSPVRVHPFGLLDDHSRFNLSLRASTDQQTLTVKGFLTEVFARYGFPTGSCATTAHHGATTSANHGHRSPCGSLISESEPATSDGSTPKHKAKRNDSTAPSIWK